MDTEFALDVQHLRELTREEQVPTLAQVDTLMEAAQARELEPLEVNLLLNALEAPGFPAIKARVLETAARIRRRVHGSRTVVMAPIEVSNCCASECFFCGWRASNRDMKRISLDRELILQQARYLIDKGIYHIELVSGDDIGFIREDLEPLFRDIKALFPAGVKGTVWFCTLALTQSWYDRLARAGADGIVVWQESYDQAVYQRNITRGPKAFGIDDDLRIRRDGDGFTFRLTSQDRALKAGMQVALGAMLGLAPDLNFEVLATIAHARHLQTNYDLEGRPLVIGLPIWNHITTTRTDNRPSTALEIEPYFSYLAALYFLVLDKRQSWIFPNCRVSLETQIEAVATCGVFTSTEVKVGPGGYLPGMLKRLEPGARARLHSKLEAQLRKFYESELDMEGFLDGLEQFQHHYHPHEEYVEALKQKGLVPAVE